MSKKMRTKPLQPTIVEAVQKTYGLTKQQNDLLMDGDYKGLHKELLDVRDIYVSDTGAVVDAIEDYPEEGWWCKVKRDECLDILVGEEVRRVV